MNKIYVGNLSYQATEEELTELFSKYGNIKSIALIKDRATGRPKGFGFIEFDDNGQADASIEMDGQEFMGRPLKVNIAREQQRTGGGGRSGGGGRGRY
jgi:RNA recognition motif-containing protein